MLRHLGDRIEGAIWGLFVGDALAMPVHWYYGGPQQIIRDFGSLITSYEHARYPFPESILQLSNTGGAGRGGDEGNIIGGIILHDKKTYWRRGGQYHYHHTLAAGENTLEASLVRVLMRSITANNGRFSAENFRSDYIDFMTTPGTHNDTYASSCHRVFFQKWKAGVAPEECPDNDGHNVDTIDGLALPAIVALAELGSGSSAADAAEAAVAALAVTRRSAALEPYVRATTELLALVLSGMPLDEAAQQATQAAYGSDLSSVVRRFGDRDPVVACYIDSSFPALLHFAKKYANHPAGDVLLASTNAGGENVHRNMVLGTIVGAAAGSDGLPPHFREGLLAYRELQEEIRSFVQAVAPTSAQPSSEL